MKIIKEEVSSINFTSASAATPEQTKYINRSLMRKWRYEDGSCSYCKANEQCIHWDGLGWSRDKKEFSHNLPEK